MWFAVAILGVIAIATGVTLLPGGTPKTPPAASAPASPTTAPPAQSGTATGQH